MDINVKEITGNDQFDPTIFLVDMYLMDGITTTKSTLHYMNDSIPTNHGCSQILGSTTGNDNMYIRSVNDVSLSAHQLYTEKCGMPEIIKLIRVPSSVACSGIILTLKTLFREQSLTIDQHYSTESVSFDKADAASEYNVTDHHIFILGQPNSTPTCVELIKRNKDFTITFYGNKDQEKYCPDLQKAVSNFTNKATKSERKFYVVAQNKYGFTLDDMDIKTMYDAESITKNYNDDFAAVDATILASINENKRGLILLHGEPGTGKTSYIKQLIAMEKERKLVYIPPHLTNILSDPSFVSFVKDELSNHVLVIEDAERVLYSRDSGKSHESAVANLLNITDGILGDALNMLIIGTFNTQIEEIDKALLRKGRLIAEYKFDLLDVEKCESIVSELYGIEAVEQVKGPMSLADIYNLEVVVHRPTEVEKPKFGFM